MKKQYIDKETLIDKVNALTRNPIENDSYDFGWNNSLENVKAMINTIDSKEVDLEKENLTWEDIRELYIIFMEVDVEIEFCKTTNIKPETIGYYQEVLKRFKAQKGE